MESLGKLLAAPGLLQRSFQTDGISATAREANTITGVSEPTALATYTGLADTVLLL